MHSHRHSLAYSQFCVHYHEYRDRLARSMRQVHRAGEKVFIDYSGYTMPVRRRHDSRFYAR